MHRFWSDVEMLAYPIMHLIEFLKQEKTSFDNSKEPSSMGTETPSVQRWKKFSDESFRNEYYNVDMLYFDLASDPTFELVQSACKLSMFKACDEPTVGNYLSRATGQKFSYIVDKLYVVSAVAEIERDKLEKVVDKLKLSFPTLRFFRENSNKNLTIPGINLPENSETLRQGFIKQGIMNQ
jgi:hypothetical protein